MRKRKTNGKTKMEKHLFDSLYNVLTKRALCQMPAEWNCLVECFVSVETGEMKIKFHHRREKHEICTQRK